MAAAGSLDCSVIIATRNRSDLLPLTLGHLEVQTHPAARYEIIIVDRGSTGKTPELLKRYAAGAPVRTHCLWETGASESKARNIAAREAGGRYLLFLEDDFLAAPDLVEKHLTHQEGQMQPAVVVGGIEPHPQVDVDVVVGWPGLARPAGFAHNQPLRFPDWRARNLSIEKAAFISEEGLSESFVCDALSDVELAHRLEKRGLRGFFTTQAVAYIWRIMPLAEVYAIHYRQGYGLCEVLQQIHDPVLIQRYAGWLRGGELRSRWSAITRPVLHAFLGDHCRWLPRMCRSHARAAFQAGYRDASRKRPPRE